jgi:two-component system, response regulator PdtaR
MQKNSAQSGKRSKPGQKPGQNVFNALTAISGVVVSGRPIEESLDRIASITYEVMNAKACSVMIYDREKQELFVKAAQGACLDLINKISNNNRILLPNDAIKGKKVLTSFDKSRTSHPILPGTREFSDIRSMISAPILYNGEPIGVINTYNGENHDFTDDEKMTMQAIADQAAAAIQLSTLMQEIINAKEALKDRKIIDKAKGILMNQRNMTEDQAYRAMRSKSMDTCKPMKEIAEAVIMTMELKPK